eukprot:scaffold3784_cov174-Amphora_coffeaeformis.AAC.4
MEWSVHTSTVHVVDPGRILIFSCRGGRLRFVNERQMQKDRLHGTCRRIRWQLVVMNEPLVDTTDCGTPGTQ